MKASAKLLPVPVAGGGAIVDLRQSEKYPIDPAVIEKLRYVPREFAEEKVREVSGDLLKVKNHYSSYIAQLNEYNNKLLSDTQKHYETYILDLKKKALDQFGALESQHSRQKSALLVQLAAKDAEMEELRDETASRISTFQENIRKLKQDHAAKEALLLDQHERREQCRVVLMELVSEVDENITKQEYATSVASLHAQKNSLSCELQHQYEISEQMNRELLHESEQSRQLAARLTIEHVIRCLENEKQKEEAALFLLQMDELKSDMSQELCVVQRRHDEMVQQIQQEHADAIAERTEALSTLQQQKYDLEQRIEQLTSDLSASHESLEASNAAVTALQQQYDEVQNQLTALTLVNATTSESASAEKNREAVVHVADLLVRDTELKLLHEELRNLESVMKSQQTEQQCLAEQINSLQETLAKEQTSSAALHIQISEMQASIKATREEHAAQEQLLKDQIVDLTQQLNNRSTDAISAEVIRPSKAPILNVARPVTVVVPSPEYQECQSSIDALLDRIAELETQLEQQKSDLSTQNALKQSTKNDIKVWMKEFEKANGHPPDNEEKAAVKDKFIAHKQASNNVQMLTTDVAATASELEALQQQLDELQQRLHSLPPTIEQVQQSETSDVQTVGGDDSAAREMLAAKERENEELRKVQQELQTATEQLRSDNQRLCELVETIKAEKRTDVIARYEKEAEELTQRVAELQEIISSNRVEKVKLETRIKELTDRIAIADAELEARDARDKAQLTADEEKKQLQGHITKQREEIVLKSKVATAGWDACADAEEKLESEVDKAYNKGLAEGKKKGAGDLKQLHTEVEGKEARIVQLLEELADAKKQLEALAREKDEAVAAASEAATREAQLQHVAATGGDLGTTSSLAAELAAAQEESAILMDRVDELEKQLTIAHRRMQLLEQMAAAGGDTTSVSPPTILATDYSSVLTRIRSAISEGTKLWKENKKDECYAVYNNLSASILSDVPPSVRRDLETAIAAAKDGPKQRGAVTLRKALDAVLKKLQEGGDLSEASGNLDGGGSVNMERSITGDNKEALRKQLQELDAEAGSSISAGVAATQADKPPVSGGGGNAALLKRAQAAESMVAQLKKQLESHPTGSKGSSTAKGGGSSDADNKKLQKKIAELETQLSRAQASGGGGDSAADKKALVAAEKKFQKQIKDMEVAARKEKSALDSKVSQLEGTVEKLTEATEALTTERDDLKKRVKELGNMSAEMETLRSKAEMVEQLRTEVQAAQTQVATLTDQYKKESQLRKKYKNELEDLKGAIRVYARVRPMAQYEKDRNCQSVVQFLDETSLRLTTSRGDKDYEFDAAFNEFVSQEQVFEDTKRLVESCVDGFNGSGKTFTMTGNAENPGLTPRAIEEMFRIINSKRDYCTSRITTYFVELYNDNLVDLYWLLDNRRNRSAEPPKLDIKMDAKKMVFIKNAIIKDANSMEELMELFRQGNAERHVGATKMNAESSRSHSIFAIMIETYDKTTKKTAIGKLSLVDLAGSERADKTGAGAERLREAQSINKSLSALGDVIAALSEGEKFIPYRNNKLTQVMQDSLGGNAKTLMFVNFSPADYNCDETATSLNYATRVKKITNNAAKQAESEEVARLKAMIKKLQGGAAIAEEDEQQEG